MNDLHISKSFVCLGKNEDTCLGCKYCRLLDGSTKGFNFDTIPTDINPIFTFLPIAVNLFYGDALLQQGRTLDILHRLNKAKHQGPIVIITKGDFTKFPKLNFDLDIHFAFSTFGKDYKLEGGTVDQFLNNLKESKRYGKYKYSIEYRPIINGINDDEKTINFVLDTAKKYGLAVGYSGLQGKPELVKYWDDEGLKFKQYPGFKFGYKKYISAEVEQLIQDNAKERNVPIFKKTSCLISYVHGLTRDYNAHYYRPNEVGCNGCVMEEKCTTFYNNLSADEPLLTIPFKYSLDYKSDHVCVLKRKGICKSFTPDCSMIKGWVIRITEKITTADVRVIKWLTGFTVDANFEESSELSNKWKVKTI